MVCIYGVYSGGFVALSAVCVHMCDYLTISCLCVS